MDFIIDNFDKLFNSEENFKKLEEIILDLAVKGKLVPQNSDDEPASVLIEKIEAEKEKLVKEKKLKKDKELEPISDEEKPFEIPDSWEWVRLGELLNLTKGKKPKNLSENQGKIPYIDVNAFDRGIINFYTDDKNIVKCFDNDLVIICDGSRSGYVGRAINGAVGSTIAKIELFLEFDNYTELYIKSIFKLLNNSMKGARIPHLDTNLLKNKLFPLPPLAEQKRIVEKVDKLMALCDNLENKVEKSQKEFEKILESSVQGVVEG